MRLHRIFKIDAMPPSLVRKLSDLVKTETGYSLLGRGDLYKVIKEEGAA